MIREWLDNNFLDYTWLLEDRVFKIGEEVYCIIKPKEGLLLDDTFDIILDDEEGALIEEFKCKYYCFKFGEWVYYSEMSQIKLTPLQYIGQSKEKDTLPFLGIHGPYELCNGSRSYKDWCRKAKFLGISTLGIAEYNTLAGTLKFQQDCLASGIKPILGMTGLVRKSDEKTYKIKLYVENEQGWKNLLYINKAINVDNEGFVTEEVLLSRLEGLIGVLEEYQEGRKEFYYQLDPVQWKSDERDKKHLENLKTVCRTEGLKRVLICDAYYLDQSHHKIKRILNRIGRIGTENQSEDQYFKTSSQASEQLLVLFGDKDFGKAILKEAIENVSSISERCVYLINTKEFHLPQYKLDEVEEMLHGDKLTLFWNLVEEGLKKKVIDKGIDPEPYYERIERECELIIRGGFVDYFLILSDIIRWADRKGILTGVGRGSSAGSIIAFCLGITKIDSIKYDLIFERFLNEGRLGKKIKQEVIIVNGDIEYEVSRKISIFRNGEQLEILANDLQNEDQIIT